MTSTETKYLGEWQEQLAEGALRVEAEERNRDVSIAYVPGEPSPFRVTRIEKVEKQANSIIRAGLAAWRNINNCCTAESHRMIGAALNEGRQWAHRPAEQERL
jgi:hypothetical protein